MSSWKTWTTIFGIAGGVLGILAATLTVLDHMEYENGYVTAHPRQEIVPEILPIYRDEEVMQDYPFGTIDQGF